MLTPHKSRGSEKHSYNTEPEEPSTGGSAQHFHQNEGARVAHLSSLCVCKCVWRGGADLLGGRMYGKGFSVALAGRGGLLVM